MAKSNQHLSQFGSAKPADKGDSQHCAQCETMLTDALDGSLSVTEQTQFDLHIAGCATCSQMLADAQRGAAWLEMLKTPRPEPPSALLERILSQTSGQTTPLGLSEAPVLAGAPALRSATVLPFRSRVAATLFQPRLAMTAAMAFFSIGLTLNITGVQLNELHASNLSPSSVKRSFYQANAHVVRYVDNLRAVYELESRVRILQREDDNDTPAIEEPSDQSKQGSGSKSQQPAQKQSAPRSGSGTSQRQALSTPIRLASFHLAEPVSSPSRAVKNIAALALATLQEEDLV